MALPNLGNAGDIILRTEFVKDSGTFTPWCGVTSVSFSINNAIVATVTRDCADWSAPLKTLKRYGAQNITMSIDATWSRQMTANLFDWAHNQLDKNIELEIVDAPSGEPHTIRATALLGQLDWAGIGNTENNPITETVELEISGDLTVTNAA